MSENPKILFTPSLSELNETIIPKLKEMISKLDKDLIQSISKTMSKLKQTDKNNPPTLQFDSLQSEPIQQYISNNQKNFNSNNDINAITSHCLILFNIIKMLVLSQQEEETSKAFDYINNELLSSSELLSHYEIVYPYLYKVCDLIVPQNSSYSRIDAFKSKYTAPNRFFNDYFEAFSSEGKNVLQDIDKLTTFMINPLSMIHFFEYSIEYSLVIGADSNKGYYFNHLFQYYKCINLIMLFFQLNFELNQYNEIMNTFLKGFITLSIEILVNNDNIPKEHIEAFFNTFLSIAYELTVNSNEVYIFALLSSLILISKNDKNSKLKTIFNNHLNSTIKNDNLTKILTKCKNIDINSDYIIQMILIRSIEYSLNKKYTKNFNDITNSISLLNIDDFIMNDLFIDSNIYDRLKHSIKNYKQKLFWLFCELSSLLYTKKLGYPKIFKFILMNHIKYQPDCKPLTYNLIQYYYLNKNFRKTKILCRKILSSVNYNSSEESKIDQIEYDIETQVLFTSSRITLLEDNYEQSKDLSILNLKRLEKNPSSNVHFISKNNILLGFAYAKKADCSINSEERQYNNEMAKKYFDIALKNISNSNITKKIHNCSFYYAHQLNELNRYEECELFLQGVDKENSNINFIALKILNKICLLKYNEAKEYCKRAMKKGISPIYLNKIYIMYYYLMIYELINFPSELNSFDLLNQDMIKTVKQVVNEINQQIEEIKKNFDSNNSNNNKINNFIVQLYSDDNITNKVFTKSKSNLNYDIKYLQNIKIEFIKNFYILCDIMYDNGLLNSDYSSLLYTLVEALDLHTLPNDDFNGLLMNGIKNKIERMNTEAENFLKKLIENCPTNVLGLKILSNFLLKEKNDLSNCYIYCMKALKIDEQEKDLWSILGEYYIRQNENKKYYQCTIKEVENAKYHHSTFLNSLIKKEIL